MINNLKLCFNCFSGKHSANNTLLHLGKDVKTDEAGPCTSTLAVTLESHGQQVNVFDIARSKVYFRAFVDSSSQSNLMTEPLAQMLRVKQTPINLSLGGV
jgi:hypothetical protein